MGISLLTIALCFSLFIATFSFDLFASSPQSNTKLTNATATVIKIASDQSMIMVGYGNGSLSSYNFNGGLMNQFIGHSSQIIDIEWIPGVGPLSLDNSGKAIKWTTNGTNVTSLLLNSSVTEMSLTSSNTTTYIGFNYGFKVAEYSITNASFVQTNTYTPLSGSTFRRIMYSPNYQYLFVGTNSSMVQSYGCSSGNYTNSSFSLGNGSTVQAFALYSNQNYLVLASNSQVFRFASAMGSTLLGNAVVASSTMAACPQSNWIAMGESSYDYIDVYDNTLFRQQRLNYIYNTVKSIDCSSNYLVSLDSSNYLAVNKYESIKVNLPGWAIGLIAGGAALILVVVVVVIVCAVIRRRRAAMMGGQMNGTMMGGQELLVTTPTNNYQSGNHYGNNEQVYLQNNFQQRY